jgi:hypothetical protein
MVAISEPDQKPPHATTDGIQRLEIEISELRSTIYSILERLANLEGSATPHDS